MLVEIGSEKGRLVHPSFPYGVLQHPLIIFFYYFFLFTEFTLLSCLAFHSIGKFNALPEMGRKRSTNNCLCPFALIQND